MLDHVVGREAALTTHVCVISLVHTLLYTTATGIDTECSTRRTSLNRHERLIFSWEQS